MILVINCGSSSIRFGVYDMDGGLLLKEKIGHIGSDKSSMRAGGAGPFDSPARSGNVEEATRRIILHLGKANLLSAVRAVGHRIVHGRNRKQAVLISDAVRAELEGNRILAPVHMTVVLRVVDAMRQLLPGILHVACFDTAFHTDLPEVARMMPLPRYLTQKGIVRYGFHGLSCTYLLRAFKEKVGEKAASGRLIIVHLGSGASMTAVKGLKSIDTTMGFTPEGGLMMGTRPGDIDPGILTYRFHLVREVIERLPETSSETTYLGQLMEETLFRHRAYINEHGLDMPQVREWKWAAGTDFE